MNNKETLTTEILFKNSEISKLTKLVLEMDKTYGIQILEIKEFIDPRNFFINYSNVTFVTYSVYGGKNNIGTALYYIGYAMAQ